MGGRQDYVLDGTVKPARSSLGSADGHSSAGMGEPTADYPAARGKQRQEARKPSHSQHLPKAGTKTDQQRLMHEEHGAIMDTMGMGGAGKGARARSGSSAPILLVAAILALVILTVALS